MRRSARRSCSYVLVASVAGCARGRYGAIRFDAASTLRRAQSTS